MVDGSTNVIIVCWWQLSDGTLIISQARSEVGWWVGFYSAVQDQARGLYGSAKRMQSQAYYPTYNDRLVQTCRGKFLYSSVVSKS